MPKTAQVRRFFFFFVLFFVIGFVDLHFLAFYPFTIRDPEPSGRAAILALAIGSCAGLAAARAKSD
jgi:hypothetical protein